MVIAFAKPDLIACLGGVRNRDGDAAAPLDEEEEEGREGKEAKEDTEGGETEAGERRWAGL